MKKLSGLLYRDISTKKNIGLAASIGMATVLAGCTVTTQVWERYPEPIKPNNLNIVRGQPLQIYFQRLSYLSQANTDIEAWKSTQLFSSVTESKLDQPAMHGYFLRVACKQSDTVSEDDELGYMMLILLSGFIIPSSERDSARCDLTMYENGIEITSNHTYIYYRTWFNGWSLLPQFFTRGSLYATHAQTAANIRVRSMMSSLTKGEK